MRGDKPGAERLARAFALLDARAARAAKSGGPLVRYLALGTRSVRLLIHSAAFLPQIERHLAYVLKDEADEYCATIVTWRDDINDVALSLSLSHQVLTPTEYRTLRVQKILGKAPYIPAVHFFDEEQLRHKPLVNANPKKDVLRAWNPQSNTYYYAMNGTSAEEFAKRGRLFAHELYGIAREAGSNVVHGAVIGLRDTGALFCGNGRRGKSTLTVGALLDGFDYVADDHLVLEKQDGILRAWPIYSRVALSPEMYSACYDTFKGKFLGNNTKQDKYIFNISAYHKQFCDGYPVKLCIYLRITNCDEPSIVPGDKGISVEELALSTLLMNGERASDAMTIGKIYSLIESFPFYRFTLSRDLDKNTRCLREFLEHFATHGQ